MTTKVYVSGVA